MIFYVTGTTNAEDVCLDFIEFTTDKGDTITCDWDESDTVKEDGEFWGRYKGIYFNTFYANGKIEDLMGATVSAIQICSQNANATLDITSIAVEDGDDRLSIPVKSGYKVYHD